MYNEMEGNWLTGFTRKPKPVNKAESCIHCGYILQERGYTTTCGHCLHVTGDRIPRDDPFNMIAPATLLKLAVVFVGANVLCMMIGYLKGGI